MDTTYIPKGYVSLSEEDDAISNAPLFELRHLDGTLKLKVYASGRVEGLPKGERVIIFNHGAVMLAYLLGRIRKLERAFLPDEELAERLRLIAGGSAESFSGGRGGWAEIQRLLAAEWCEPAEHGEVRAATACDMKPAED